MAWLRILLVAAFCALPCHAAASGQNLEYQVKAAFLLNFTKFIEWPAAAFQGAESPITICVFGEDPFGATLEQVVGGESVNGRALAVQRIRSTPPPKSCQVVFIGRLERDETKLLSELGEGVLTVGQGDIFLRDGGMIAFVIDKHRVRFDINQTATASAGLKISSKLMSVARSVAK